MTNAADEYNRSIVRFPKKTCGVSNLTTEPNALVASIHNRMPVILGGNQIDSWLTDGGKDFLKPCLPEMLHTYPVSDQVNKVANNDASNVEAVAS